MKKGWRNDPAWVAHYERVAKERHDAMVEKRLAAWRLEKACSDADAAMARLRTRIPTVNTRQA